MTEAFPNEEQLDGIPHPACDSTQTDQYRHRSAFDEAWQVESAHGAEAPLVPSLLDMAALRGFSTSDAILHRGYDVGPVYEACEARDIRPIIPLRETLQVKRGEAATPLCEHGP